ncbi:hypothetical protein PILCRDRAFT_703303 [Piloderma croceum F 1598]|uniref:Uncharacterized protein n=1 Tax=Piloderma croceum (strain F 1598) TaxID=765440 RepID=A0A0C3BAZ2_PILCF|nr:hypothetical protein PILCRDRAFT_703303 [Piloderma croceum F 1598]
MMIMAVRLCSLYGHRKLLIWSLRGLLFLAFIGLIVTLILFQRTFQTFLYYEFLQGCWGITPYHAWYLRAIMLLVEGVFVILMGYKLLSYHNEMNPVITMLARDSIFYFLVIFSFLMLDLISDVDARFYFNLTIPTMCISTIAVSHMMMNIRGLIMDDPEHTNHLQTLEFATRTNSGSEIEMTEIE